MKDIILSSHTYNRASELKSRRYHDYSQDLQAYNLKLQEFKDLKEKLSADWHDALMKRDMVRFEESLRLFKALDEMPIPDPPVLREETPEEIVWQAGKEGEKQISAQFRKALDKQWTMVAGYKNGGGEADRLLVGPNGVIVVEIKHMNGYIKANGDVWLRDKYDNYDHLIEPDSPIMDMGGRSPSQQVNAVANRLQQFLIQRDAPITHVYRAVAFSHEKSRLVDTRNLTIDFAWDVNVDISAMLEGMTDSLTPTGRAKILRLIQRDHEYHKPDPQKEQKALKNLRKAAAAVARRAAAEAQAEGPQPEESASETVA